MANNRLWLVHHPTKTMILLAKHFGHPWMPQSTPEDLWKFFSYTRNTMLSETEEDYYAGIDDLELMIEDGDNSPNLREPDWDRMNEYSRTVFLKEKTDG